ncbi:MAG: hypothetical protein Q9162_004828 [Coniocarpon cinnabarinum]
MSSPVTPTLVPENLPDTLWQEAWKRLPLDVKKYLPEDESCTSEDVQGLLEDRLNTLRKRGVVTKTKSGKVFVVRDAYEKIATWIARFVKVGDVAVQYDPIHAALPWAVIRFVIQPNEKKASINGIQLHALVREGIETTVQVLLWAALEQRLYLRKTSSVFQRLQRAFVDLYEKIFLLTGSICKFLRQGTARKMLCSNNEHDRLLQAIKADKQLVEGLAQQVDREDHLDQSREVQRFHEALHQLDEPLKRSEYCGREAVRILGELERETILDWTSQVPYQQHYRKGREKGLKGTGAWLFSHPSFINWKSSSFSEIVWLHGKPGSGKSTLLSQLIESLIDEHELHGSPIPAYFYCARSAAERDRSDPEQVLRCLVRQVATLSGKQIHQTLKERYDKRSIAGPIHTADRECEDMISCIACDRALTYIIVDALDECSRDTRQDLVNALGGILRKSSSLVKIFVSSRDDVDLVLSMRDYPEIRIEAADNEQDIAFYISHKLGELTADKKLLPAEGVSTSLREQIERRLCEGAQGMFRWVELQLQSLRKYKTPRALIQRLGHLPETLNNIYQDLYDRHVEDLVPEERKIVRAILSWLLICQRQLQSAELIALVCYETGEDSGFTIQTMLDLCFNLLEYDERSDVFRFSHLSVREFLEQSGQHYEGWRMQDMATLACLEIIQDTSFSFENAEDYAQWFWPCHASAIGACEDAQSMAALSAFLSPKSEAFEVWSSVVEYRLRRTHSVDEDSQHFLMSMCVGCPPNALLLACQWGLELPIRNMVKDIGIGLVNPTIRNSKGQNALSIAARRGHTTIVQLLLDSGIDEFVGTKSQEYALRAASHEGYPEIVRLLLDRGADMYAASLYAAASGGHQQIVDLLLSRESGTNDKDEYGTEQAVVVASREGQMTAQSATEAVAKVKNMGPPVSARFIDSNPGGKYGTALQAAAYKGHEGIVRELLERGADVNVQGGSYGTALHAAAYRAHGKTVQLLLRNGADVNIQDHRCGTALHLAIRRGKESVLSALQLSGARLDMFDPAGRSVLHLAAIAFQSDFHRWMHWLVAHVNTTDNQGWTPAHWAAYFGREQYLHALIVAGGDMSAKDWNGWTPFQLASFANFPRIPVAQHGYVGIEDCAACLPQPGTPLRHLCDSCDHILLDFGFRCETCVDYDLCFRCGRDAAVIHPGHAFRKDYPYRKEHRPEFINDD